MDWKLGVVVVPVTDIDRAKDFYVGKLGFHLGGKFVFFSDPDGNQWAVQEVRERVGAELG
jgi:catechol 2,3-dioxygenase-like lactoylglutathione lyase family enzyme